MSKKKKVNHKKEPRSSSLNQHKQVGKTLIPPLMQVGNINFSSWVNDRIPEYLWSCLLIHFLPRNEVLDIFRKISDIGSKYINNEEYSHDFGLKHSQLACLPDDIFFEIMNVIFEHPLGKSVLKPLILIESLPGKKRWANILTIEPQSQEWQVLSEAVAGVLDHQSQTATDIRWLVVLFKIKTNQLIFPEKMKKVLSEIINYPNQGDMSAIRPCIRVLEMSLNQQDTTINWSEIFWTECLRKTNCISGELKILKLSENDDKQLQKKVNAIQNKLFEHCSKTLATSKVDAKHDTIFGFGFYAITLISEVLTNQNRHSITGRLVLKTLTDCRISIAYLLKENTDNLWLKFRQFGSGQAKLALLKLENLENEIPSFINANILSEITNEDFYQEFVNIDVGHWCGIDLRKMAEKSGTKNDYDKYYGWSSMYSHGHWSALRETCFTKCFNPLHRLHRIPRLVPRNLEDILPDAISLINNILEDINKNYPGLTDRL